MWTPCWRTADEKFNLATTGPRHRISWRQKPPAITWISASSFLHCARTGPPHDDDPSAGVIGDMVELLQTKQIRNFIETKSTENEERKTMNAIIGIRKRESPFQPHSPGMPICSNSVTDSWASHAAICSPAFFILLRSAPGSLGGDASTLNSALLVAVYNPALVAFSWQPPQPVCQWERASPGNCQRHDHERCVRSCLHPYPATSCWQSREIDGRPSM